MSIDRPRSTHPLAHILALGFAAFSLFLSTVTAANESSANAVRQTFAEYRLALLRQDGDAAVEVLSQPTVDYYAAIQQLAVCGSEDEVKGHSFIDRMQVLLMRLRVPTGELLTMSGRETLIYAIEQGWVGRSDVASASVGNVTITNGTAVGQHVVQGQPSEAKFYFVNEGGAWKLDLLPTIQASGKAMSMLAKQQNRQEDDWLFQLVGLVTQRQLTDAAWEPISPRSSQCQMPSR